MVKLFGEALDGPASYAVELGVHRLLADHPYIPAAELLGTGNLFDDEPRWGYLITTRLAGTAMRDLELSDIDSGAVARQMGEMTARLHQLSPPPAFKARTLLPALRANAAERLRRFGLPDRLVEQVPSFLEDALPPSVFVHADLTADHLFVEGGRLVGVIDWGDATVAGPYYELVALFFDASPGGRSKPSSSSNSTPFPACADWSTSTMCRRWTEWAHFSSVKDDAMGVWREPWDDVPFPDLTDEQLTAIAETHGLNVPQPIIRRLPSVGVVNSVYALGERWVLRVPKNLPDATCDTLTESVAVPVACAAGVRTPALAVFDETREIVDVPYTIYERAEGAALTELGSEPRRWDGLWAELGRNLATLHQGVAECPDPLGRLDEQGRTCEFEPLLGAAVDEGAINADNARTLADWFEHLRPAVLAGEGYRRFLHGDAQIANVLVKPNGDYSALIDWGDAGWGDPALDLRSVPARTVGLVLAGYRQVAPLDGDESAEARIWWDHLWSAVYALRRDRVDRRGDWTRPPGARIVELLALVAEGGTIGRF